MSIVIANPNVVNLAEPWYNSPEQWSCSGLPADTIASLVVLHELELEYIHGRLAVIMAEWGGTHFV